jgi:hypothetical protein
MSEMMHLIVATILFSLTWHLILKKTWPMQEKIYVMFEKYK